MMKNLKTLLIVAATVAATGSAFAASHVGAPMGLSDTKKESTSSGHDAADSKKDKVATPADAHKDAAAAKAESKKDGATGATAAAGDLTKGEVRKVDLENKKITIKHGAIKNLDMPGMTMVFQVKDPAMLDKIKVGDKISFAAEKSGEMLVVTEIKPAK